MAVESRNQINLRLTDEDAERLDALAEHYAITSQNVIRMLVKRAADEVEATSTKNRPRSAAK